MTRLQRTVFVQRLPGRQRRCGQRGRLGEAQPPWLARQAVGIHHNPGGIGADDADESHDLIPRCQRGDVAPYGDNGAGGIHAGRERQGKRDERLHGATDDFPVDRIHPGSGDIDQDLVIAGNGIIQFGQGHGVRAAIGSNTYGFHQMLLEGTPTIGASRASAACTGSKYSRKWAIRPSRAVRNTTYSCR